MCEQHVHTLRLDCDRNADWERWLLLMADCHWDNPLCRRDLLRRHLDEAIERNARVMVFGDLFCLMGGKYDPRRSKGKVRPEHNVDNYLDAVVRTAADWWSPYAEHLELVSPGNHETAILKNLETDVTARFADRLDPAPAVGTYQGWVRIMLDGNSGGYHQSLKLRYHHGHGGGGVVTKGTLWPQRRAAWWPDADIVVSGHIHEQWSFPVTRERLSEAGVVKTDTQLHPCTPTYKDETTAGVGWAVEKGMSPRPLGAWWVRLFWRRAEGRVLFEEVRAQ